MSLPRNGREEIAASWGAAWIHYLLPPALCGTASSALCSSFTTGGEAGDCTACGNFRHSASAAFWPLAPPPGRRAGSPGWTTDSDSRSTMISMCRLSAGLASNSFAFNLVAGRMRRRIPENRLLSLWIMCLAPSRRRGTKSLREMACLESEVNFSENF